MRQKSFGKRTREQNQLRQTKKNSKIWYFYSGFFLSICLVLVILFIAHTNQLTQEEDKKQKETEIEQYKEKEKQLFSTIRESQSEQGIASLEEEQNKKSSRVITYTPTSTDLNVSLAPLKKDMNQKIEEIQTNKKLRKQDVLVGQIKQKSVSDKLTQYYTVVDTYLWDESKKTWFPEQEICETDVFINQESKKALTLRELFNNNEANLLATQQIIQQKLLSESSDSEKILDAVLLMPNLSLDQTLFYYQPDGITIELPNVIADQQEVKVSFKEIAEYINTSFVNPEVIEGALSPPLDPSKKYISLTFDDGPNPITTPKLLDILQEKQVKATFFMLGQNIAKNPDLVKRVANEGHEVANHSFSHPQLTTIGNQRVKDEIIETDRAIFQITGKLSTSFRPPYGAVNENVAKIIGKPIIQWSVDSQDWQSHNTEMIINRVDSTASKDSIVLMHDIYPQTIAAVPIIIDNLRAAGFEIIPSKELLMNKAKPMRMYYGATTERLIP